MKKVLALALLGMLFSATLVLAADKDTSRREKIKNSITIALVQGAAEGHIKDRYPGSSQIQMSPVNNTTLGSENAWFVAARFVYLNKLLLGEFWVQPEKKTSGVPVVVKSQFRRLKTP